MTKATIGLWFDRWAQSRFEGERLRTGSFLRLFRKAIWFKANPRDRDYMKALFSERFPEGQFIEIYDTDDCAPLVKQADTVVLLYPDSIGIGFFTVERSIRQALAPQSEVVVLNGRRRQFRLSGMHHRQLLLRRFLEKTMLGEMIIVLLFCIITPVFLATDLFAGRR